MSPSPDPIIPENIKILLADDDKRQANILRTLLGMAGYTNVVVLYDGASLVQEYKKRPWEFDLVIADINMPEKNGIQSIREIHDIKPVPSILITAEATEEALKEMRKGFRYPTEFLNKPFTHRDKDENDKDDHDKDDHVIRVIKIHVEEALTSLEDHINKLSIEQAKQFFAELFPDSTDKDAQAYLNAESGRMGIRLGHFARQAAFASRVVRNMRKWKEKRDKRKE